MNAATTIAVAASVIAVISLLVAWQQGRRSLRITTYSGATDLTLKVDAMFVEHPELRPYFSEAVPLSPATPERTRQQVLAAAEFILDVLECIWDHHDEYDDDDRQSWWEYIVDFIQESPVLTEVFADLRARDWYPALDEAFTPSAERTVARRGDLWLRAAPRRTRAAGEVQLFAVRRFRLVRCKDEPAPVRDPDHRARVREAPDRATAA